MIKSFLPLCALGLMLAGCSKSKTDAPMLTGHFEGEVPSSVTMYYDIDGVTTIEEIDVDSTGTFVFNPELPVEQVDVTFLSGKDVYGARVAKGDAAEATINGENISFQGDNADINNFLSAYHNAYNYMKFKVKPDQIEAGYDFGAQKAMLDEGAEKARTALGSVPAADRDYYTALNNAGYDYVLLSILSSDHYLNKNDHTAEMNEIVGKIDPNSDAARVSGLLSMWMRSDSTLNVKILNMKDSLGFTAAQIKAIDEVLTNQANKNNLYGDAASMMLFYNPTDEALEKFFADVKPQFDKAPAVEAQLRQQIAESKKVVADGDALPSDPIVISPDGTKQNLSSLFDGKIVYIDLWATWCGPCCREIPFLEKVVEQYKDNDNVKFISISCDQDKEAWLKKLAKDNPTWPQYIFDEKSGNEFMKAMHANGIPRFFLIGRDGKFILVNATRPSNPKMIEELNAALGAE